MRYYETLRDEINYFREEYEFLSNFYPVKVKITSEKFLWLCAKNFGTPEFPQVPPYVILLKDHLIECISATLILLFLTANVL